MTETAPVDIEPGEGDDAEVEPVEVLVSLAEQGEIDPWDIDIIQVTDAFLAAIDDREIRTSGRALFYASVLLRMKSDELFAPEEGADPEAPDRIDPTAEPDPLEGPTGDDPIDQLEAEMDRRLERQSARGTPETLDELVRELREAERGSWWKSGRSYDTEHSPRGFKRGVQTLDYRAGDDARSEGEPDEESVTGTAHGEDIEELIEAVAAELAARYDRGRPEVLFAEIADAAGSRVETFLALLFLSHRGAVFLDQDDLFGDLWIRDRGLEVAAVTEAGVEEESVEEKGVEEEGVVEEGIEEEGVEEEAEDASAEDDEASDATEASDADEQPDADGGPEGDR